MREHQPEGGVQPEAAAAEPAQAGTSPYATVLRLQQGAGNSAVAAAIAASGGLILRQGVAAPPPPVAAPAGPAAETHSLADIRAMTLSDFDAFAERQADWHGNRSLPAADRAKLRRLLEFARGEQNGTRPILTGCGGMTVSALLATGMTWTIRQLLLVYGRAVAHTVDTVELRPTDDVAKALDYARALQKLERAPGGPIIKKIIRQDEGKDQLNDLIAAGAVDAFVRYCRTCRPVLHADNGAEIESYLALRAEGVDPASYHGRLPDVRSFHRFEKAALDRLIANRRNRTKTKPLALILHSAFDHNGAFHRDPNLTAAISDARNVTLMIEGAESLAAISHRLRPLARAYGQGSRISQVMLAGHGNAQLMEMAGTVDAAGNETTDAVDIGGNKANTDAFFQELLRNMANDPNSRIVLNACLTASNSVNAPLSADPNVAAGQVGTAIAAQPSLATYLQGMARGSGSAVDVRGANASIGQVGLIDPATGQFDIQSGYDPAVTATKATYVRSGREPLGAMRAVLEVWATDRQATPQGTSCRDAITQRLADPASTEWDELIIRSLYRLVLANFDNAELIRQLGNFGGNLSEIQFEQECRVGRIRTVPGGHGNTIFGDVARGSTWTGLARVRLVVHQVWMTTDTTKRAPFLTDLATFTCADARPYVAIGHLAGQLPHLLPLGEAASPSRGRLVLSLLGVVNSMSAPEATSRSFLREVVRLGGRSGFDPALDIDGILGGASDRGSVERAIGVGAAAPPGGGGGGGGAAGPPPNVDLDGDGTNDFYVEPMTRTGAVTAQRLNVRQRPGLTEPVIGGLDAATRTYVIGKSADWYAIEFRGRTAFVFQSWVRLSPSF